MFGFGKKKQPEAAPTQPQQLSPEAQAILQRLQAQAGQPPGQAMQGAQTPAQQTPAQQAPAQQIPAQQVPGQQLPGQQTPHTPAGAGAPVPAGLAPQNTQQILMSALQAAPGQPAAPQSAMPPSAQMPQMGMQTGQIPAPQMQGQPAVPPGVSGFDMAGMSAPLQKSKREIKKEQAAEKRAEKEKKAKQATEEKTRKKRRKQLSKMRFSRARYLREANANLIANIVLWLFMLAILIGGTVSLVNLYLAPITETNQQTIREIEQLRATIRNSQPQIQQALSTRRERESEVQLLASTLPTTDQIRSQVEQFIDRMKAADIIVKDENIQSVDLGSPSITGIQFSANITTSYLKWLQERNRFMRRQAFGRIPVERITASDTSSEITVELTLILPAAN